MYITVFFSEITPGLPILRYGREYKRSFVKVIFISLLSLFPQCLYLPPTHCTTNGRSDSEREMIVSQCMRRSFALATSKNEGTLHDWGYNFALVCNSVNCFAVKHVLMMFVYTYILLLNFDVIRSHFIVKHALFSNN